MNRRVWCAVSGGKASTLKHIQEAKLFTWGIRIKKNSTHSNLELRQLYCWNNLLNKHHLPLRLKQVMKIQNDRAELRKKKNLQNK